MTKKPSEKNKTWEKERRDRLNKAFEQLAKLLPQYDPSVTWSKNEIIQKSIDHIKNIHEKHENYLQTNDPEILDQYNELIEALKFFQSRNGQLSELLRKANITVPPLQLPKICTDNLKFCESSNLNEINTKSTGRPKKYSNKLQKTEEETSSNDQKLENIETKKPEKELATNLSDDIVKEQVIELQESTTITSTTTSTTNVPITTLNSKAIITTGVLLPLIPCQRNVILPTVSSVQPTIPILPSSIPKLTNFTSNKCKILNIQTIKNAYKFAKDKDGRIKILPRPGIKLHFRRSDGKLPIPVLKRRIMPIKRKRKRCRKIKNQSNNTKDINDENQTKLIIAQKRKNLHENENNLISNDEISKVPKMIENDLIECSSSKAQENIEKEIIKITENPIIPSPNDNPNDYFTTLQIQPNETTSGSVSPTAAFLLSFPVVSTAGGGKNIIDETSILANNERKDNESLENLNTFFTTKEYHRFCERNNEKEKELNGKSETILGPIAIETDKMSLNEMNSVSTTKIDSSTNLISSTETNLLKNLSYSQSFPLITTPKQFIPDKIDGRILNQTTTSLPIISTNISSPIKTSSKNNKTTNNISTTTTYSIPQISSISTTLTNLPYDSITKSFNSDSFNSSIKYETPINDFSISKSFINNPITNFPKITNIPSVVSSLVTTSSYVFASNFNTAKTALPEKSIDLNLSKTSYLENANSSIYSICNPITSSPYKNETLHSIYTNASKTSIPTSTKMTLSTVTTAIVSSAVNTISSKMNNKIDSKILPSSDSLNLGSYSTTIYNSNTLNTTIPDYNSQNFYTKTSNSYNYPQNYVQDSKMNLSSEKYSKDNYSGHLNHIPYSNNTSVYPPISITTSNYPNSQITSTSSNLINPLKSSTVTVTTQNQIINNSIKPSLTTFPATNLVTSVCTTDKHTSVCNSYSFNTIQSLNSSKMSYTIPITNSQSIPSHTYGISTNNSYTQNLPIISSNLKSSNPIPPTTFYQNLNKPSIPTTSSLIPSYSIPSTITTNQCSITNSNTNSVYSSTKNYYSQYSTDTSNFTFNLTTNTSTMSIVNSLSPTQSLITYSTIKPEIPWIPPPPPPPVTTDYKLPFTFSLTPSTTTPTNLNKTSKSMKPNDTIPITTKSHTISSLTTTISNSYTTTNFTFSLTEPKTSIVSTIQNRKTDHKEYSTNYTPYNFDSRHESRDSINFTFALTKPTKTALTTQQASCTNQQQLLSSFSIDSTLGVNHNTNFNKKFPSSVSSSSASCNHDNNNQISTITTTSNNSYNYEIKSQKLLNKNHVNWMTSSSSSSTATTDYHYPTIDFGQTTTTGTGTNCYPSHYTDLTFCSENYPTNSSNFDGIKHKSYNNNINNNNNYKTTTTPIITTTTSNQNQNNFFSVSQLVDQRNTSTTTSSTSLVSSTKTYENNYYKKPGNKSKDSNSSKKQQSQNENVKNQCTNSSDINNIQNSYSNILYNEQKTTTTNSNNYSAEALISKKENHRNYTINYNNSDYYNTSSLEMNNSSYLPSETSDNSYNSNYFYNYLPNQNYSQEIDYYGTTYLIDGQFNNTNTNTSNNNNNNNTNNNRQTAIIDQKSTNLIKNEKKLPTSSIQLPPPPPIPSSVTYPSNLISYDSNYFPVPPIIHGPVSSTHSSSDLYDSHHYSNNNYQHNTYPKPPIYHHSHNSHHGQHGGHQTNINHNQHNNSQTGSGNLTNFNLSTICPEINEKVVRGTHENW